MVDQNTENQNPKDTAEVTEEPVVEAADTDQVLDTDANDAEVQAFQEQVGQLEDQLLRVQAEVQNIQQRNAREVANIRKYDGQKLATAIVPIVDNLERALAVEDGEDEIALQIKKGVEITLKTLRQALTDNGISEVGQVGDEFDPTTMQGVQTVDAADFDGVEAEQVAQILQKGYLLHDRVIRPAMVAVAK